jgi:hypothetical protein
MITPRFQDVTVGEAVEFRCTAEGYPLPRVEWSRPTGSLPRNAEVVEGVLRIASVSKSDESEYLCTAFNSEGSDIQKTYLYVQGGWWLETFLGRVGVDYRCDDGCFWVSTKNCQLPTPTSQKLRLE